MLTHSLEKQQAVSLLDSGSTTDCSSHPRKEPATEEAARSASSKELIWDQFPFSQATRLWRVAVLCIVSFFGDTCPIE